MGVTTLYGVTCTCVLGVLPSIVTNSNAMADHQPLPGSLCIYVTISPAELQLPVNGASIEACSSLEAQRQGQLKVCVPGPG